VRNPFPPRNLFELPLFGESEDFWVELKEITVSTALHCICMVHCAVDAALSYIMVYFKCCTEAYRTICTVTAVLYYTVLYCTVTAVLYCDCCS
jgi:hypothetical protein